MKNLRLTGYGISSGLGVGTAHLYRDVLQRVESVYCFRSDNEVERECQRLDSAIDQVRSSTMWKRYTHVVAASLLAALIGACWGCGDQEGLAPTDELEPGSPQETEQWSPEPAQPGQPEEPAQPGSAQPGQPAQPGSAQPGQPGAPAQPGELQPPAQPEE